MKNSQKEDKTNASLTIPVQYTASWFNNVSHWVETLPLPVWLMYPLFGLVLMVVGLVIQQVTYSGTILEWHPINFVTIFQSAYIFLVTHYLDKHAVLAFEAFKPALSLDKNGITKLRRMISTLPSGKTLLADFIFMTFCMMPVVRSLLTGQSMGSAMSFNLTPFGIYSILTFLLLWLSNGLIIYHTFHQLNVIHYILTSHTVVHPFHQRELYAFSGLSARTGIAFALTAPLWIVFDPGLSSLIICSVFAVLGLAAFIAPLIGVHRILQIEKDRLMYENSRQMEDTITLLLQQKRNGSAEDLSRIDLALTALKKARIQVEKYQPGHGNQRLYAS
jgi:hypothetical protein